jgi:hypothetical protein
LKDAHDYGKWSRPGPLTEDLDFDADHLNPVGAGKFTRAVLAKFLQRKSRQTENQIQPVGTLLRS